MYVLFPHVAVSLIWAGLPRRLSRFTMPVVGACLGGALLDGPGFQRCTTRICSPYSELRARAVSSGSLTDFVNPNRPKCQFLSQPSGLLTTRKQQLIPHRPIPSHLKSGAPGGDRHDAAAQLQAQCHVPVQVTQHDPAP